MSERIYTTRSSGHGSDYVPFNPEVFNMTLEEARADVVYWELHADTIGGRGIVVRNDGEIIE